MACFANEKLLFIKANMSSFESKLNMNHIFIIKILKAFFKEHKCQFPTQLDRKYMILNYVANQ